MRRINKSKGLAPVKDQQPLKVAKDKTIKSKLAQQVNIQADTKPFIVKLFIMS